MDEEEEDSIIPPLEGPFKWELRVAQLEAIARNLWPGKDEETKSLRWLNIWHIIDDEVPWDRYKEAEPDHHPVPTTREAVVDICTVPLLAPLGKYGGLGYGDSLRAELKRRGTSLEALFEFQRPPLEHIPWEELEVRPHRPHSRELLEIRKRIYKNKPHSWNKP